MAVRLQPGDCLLYRPTGILGRIIAIKTWHPVAHVEIAVAPGKAVAARDLRGVNLYPTRWSELAYVVRPTAPFDIKKAMEYFDEVRGQPYDLFGLFRFFGKKGETTDKQFCSEFATRFYRAGGLDPFPGEPADLVPPFYFAGLTDGFQVIWNDTDGALI
jgi:hypothetical protein